MQSMPDKFDKVCPMWTGGLAGRECDKTLEPAEAVTMINYYLFIL